MNKNICHFIPYHKDYYSIHTIKFVSIQKPQVYDSLKSQSVYKIYFVCGGRGKLHLEDKTVSLKEGDVFFTFPAVPFCIESEESFSYMYISFLGSRANMIMEKLEISPQNFLFNNCREVCDFCQNGFNSVPETTEWISESILLYSFHYLGNRIISKFSERTEPKENISLKLKKYIDDNITQPTDSPWSLMRRTRTWYI